MSTEIKKLETSQLKQQRLPAWQPILTPPYASGCFVLVAAVFIPLGFAILAANNDVTQVEFRYDNLRRCTSADNDGLYNYTDGTTYLGMGCKTSVAFNLTSTMNPPVYLYYRLGNFYQSHRRYLSSRLDAQLAGELVSSMSDADPYATVGDAVSTKANQITLAGTNYSYGNFRYSPAGLIAWSMFNDSFSLYRYDGAGFVGDLALTTPKTLVCNGSDFSHGTNEPLNQSVTANRCHKKGIAWSSDVAEKYKVPSMDTTTWTAPRSAYGGVNVPSNDAYYNHGWYANELGHRVPVTTDEDLMVWMRTASLPDFNKLYRVIDVALVPGTYVMEITELFDVSPFQGSKGFLMTTLSWLGGKNEFLSTLFLVVGGFSVGAAILFLVLHKVCGTRVQRAIDALAAEQ